MKIDSFSSDEQILIELGERIKVERIRSGLTQEQLAKQSGVAKSTIERFEKGESIQFLNLLKLLRALRKLDSVDLLLPSQEKTPFEYINYPKIVKKQRVRNSSLTIAEKSTFKWGDEK